MQMLGVHSLRENVVLQRPNVEGVVTACVGLSDGEAGLEATEGRLTTA